MGQKKRNQYFVPEFIDNETQCAYYVYIDIRDMKPADCILEQFTGLYDSEGTEIYEGGIVENESGRRCLVYYFCTESHCGWDLKYLGGSGKINSDRMWHGQRVVGNVHQNPELLGELK